LDFSIKKWTQKLVGTETELVLKNRNIIPGRLNYAGFKFKFTSIKNALIDLM